MYTTLVILAAGLGSRFGGLKQMEPLGKSGEIIADFSVYDAIQAGFTKVVFVIKEAMEADFREKVVNNIKGIQVELAFQHMDDLPEGCTPTPARERPWGTSHALWAARHVVHEPFMVISADDFYGRGVFTSMCQFLKTQKDETSFAMPGHMLENTISKHGTVSRAICTVDENGFLTDIVEKRKIQRQGDVIVCEEDADNQLACNSIVNMLAFGFSTLIFQEIEKGFDAFLKENAQNLDAEYFLNATVKKMLKAGKATMRVLPVTDQWMGITYKEDLEKAKCAIWGLIDKGEYPEKLF